MNNHKWLMLQAHGAETREQLQQVLVDIQNDQFEGEDWTKDTTRLNQLRHYFARQCEKLGIEMASLCKARSE